LRLDLAQYRELAAFAQFGSDLDKETQARLDRGQRLYELLKQEQYDPLRTGEQVMILYAGTRGYLDEIEVKNIRRWETEFRMFLSEKHPKLLDELETNTSIEEKLERQITSAIDQFSKIFNN